MRSAAFFSHRTRALVPSVGAPRQIGALACVLLVYMLTRMPLLSRLPVFVDEAVHVQWAQATLGGDVMAGMWAGRWLPVKLMSFLLLLPIDTLVAVRVGTVVTGMFTVVFITLIGNELSPGWGGTLAGLAYVAMPFTLFYDRLALVDPYLSTSGALVILASIRITQRPTLGNQVLLGGALAAAVLCKLTAALLLLTPVVAVISFAPRADWLRHCRWMVLSVGANVVLVGFLLWRNAGTHLVAAQTAGIEPQLVMRNAQWAVDWYAGLLTWPLLLTAGAAVVWAALGSRARSSWFLLFVLCSVSLPYVLVSNVWFPRYLLLSCMVLSLLIGRFIDALWRSICAYPTNTGRRKLLAWTAAAVSLCLVAVAPVRLGYDMVVTPETANLPGVERWQYVSGWSAGYGLPELATLLKEIAARTGDTIDVVRFHYWGPSYQGLDVYLGDTATIHTHVLDPQDRGSWSGFGVERPAFFVANLPRDLEELHPVARTVAHYLGNVAFVASYPKPGGESELQLWRVVTPAP